MPIESDNRRLQRSSDMERSRVWGDQQIAPVDQVCQAAEIGPQRPDDIGGTRLRHFVRALQFTCSRSP
jgi:hypothetical protein